MLANGVCGPFVFDFVALNIVAQHVRHKVAMMGRFGYAACVIGGKRRVHRKDMPFTFPFVYPALFNATLRHHKKSALCLSLA